MSTEQRNPVTFPSTAAFTPSQLFIGVAMGAGGNLVLPAAGAPIIGVLYAAGQVNSAGQYQNEVFTVGEGRLKLQYGGTVTLPTYLKVNAAGQFIAANASDIAAGAAVAIASKAGASGDIGEGVLLGSAGAALATGFDDIVLGTTAPSNATPTSFVQVTGT